MSLLLLLILWGVGLASLSLLSPWFQLSARDLDGNEYLEQELLNWRQLPNEDDSKAYIAICLAFKADAREQLEDLREWLMYYQGMGIKRIYLMDNYDAGSGIPALSTVSDLASSGFVVYHHIPRSALPANIRPQLSIYDMCLSEHRHQHSWMMFIDVDEFIVEPPSQTLTEILAEFEAADVGGLAVNWQMMGSDDLIDRPEGGVLRSYTSCDPRINRHIKTIANTKYVTRALNPHFFEYVPGKHAVNIKSITAKGPWSDPSDIDPENDLVIYHYVLKSLEDYQRKMATGSANANHKKIGYFHAQQLLCVSRCTRLSSL